MKFLFEFKNTWYLLLLGVISFKGIGQEKQSDSLLSYRLNEVEIESLRIKESTPIAHSNVSKEEIEKRNLGQDIPILLNYLPSVVTTSDAGNGIGYTGIRVRGSDASRVNVTINGVPYNDSESHGTFWVNLPDFASSVSSVQLQRGVGSSTNGAGAFGASLHVSTEKEQDDAYLTLSNSFGSFNSRKHTVAFGSGKINEHLSLQARLSNVYSDGFIDRASSDLKGYFFQGNYVNNKTKLKFLTFGGKEKTYQAWYGIEDKDILENQPTYNVAGMYTDQFGQVQFYDNETDNYSQDHYQLHWNQKYNSNFESNVGLHYTYGRGYYEQYKEDQQLVDYQLDPINHNGTLVDKTDLIRQKWLKNHFYGVIFSTNYKKSNFQWINGGGFNHYVGGHFGEIIWARQASNSEIGQRYYDFDSDKNDFNFYSKVNYVVAKKVELFGDLQYRLVTYKAEGIQDDLVDDQFNFFNPKVGVTFHLNKNNQFYASFAAVGKEPRRSDYENNSTKAEYLNDFELGWRVKPFKKSFINVNAFYMDYKDQLVLTGAIDDVGAPVFTNSGSSFRAGIELDAQLFISDKIQLQPNLTYSQNKNRDFYFERDGVLNNLGQTNIAFSPELIFANQLEFKPIKDLSIGFLSKFVSEQYMGNIDSKESLLPEYFINDLSINYQKNLNKIFKKVRISAVVNNIFDQTYQSNGYFYTYDDDFSVPGQITTIEGAGYYPQAGINFLTGLTLEF